MFKNWLFPTPWKKDERGKELTMSPFILWIAINCYSVPHFARFVSGKAGKRTYDTNLFNVHSTYILHNPPVLQRLRRNKKMKREH